MALLLGRPNGRLNACASVSRVNIAQITVDYQTPCTTSTMRCVTTTG